MLSARPALLDVAQAAGPPVRLASEADRARLSPAALRAFFRLVGIWRVDEADARALLGFPSAEAFSGWRENPVRTLDTDTLLRISCMLGIYKALHGLLGEPVADEWVRLPNAGPLFGGWTPIACMVEGGLPAMLAVRRYLDALQGDA